MELATYGSCSGDVIYSGDQAFKQKSKEKKEVDTYQDTMIFIKRKSIERNSRVKDN